MVTEHKQQQFSGFERIRNVNLHRDRVHKVVPTANYS